LALTQAPGQLVANVFCSAGHRLVRLASLVSGLEVDRHLADATPIACGLGWEVPLRLVQSSCPEKRSGTDIPPLPANRRQRATQAIDRLRELCDLSEEKAADVMRVARGSIRSWRAGEREPYPATTRHLFEIDSVVSSLIRSLGHDAAKGWLREAGLKGGTKLDMLSEEDGPERVLDLARQTVFSRRELHMLPSAENIENLDEIPEPEAYVLMAFSGGPVHERKVPRCNGGGYPAPSSGLVPVPPERSSAEVVCT
jgi:transcriptional regulator with XRE-family HTH domain